LSLTPALQNADAAHSRDVGACGAKLPFESFAVSHRDQTATFGATMYR
jgi:hypothetical protein